VYVDIFDYQLIDMDTYSSYLCISTTHLEDIIKPELKDMYERGLKGFCKYVDVEDDDIYYWFPGTCCVKYAKYDKSTPGIFKTEY